MSEAWFQPDFDLAQFRYAVARYIKLLIRARWKCEPEFLRLQDLVRWELQKLNEDAYPAWRLLRDAADALARLNTEFLSRCGSGGIPITDESTPEGRLLESVAFLAETSGGGPFHNQPLLDATESLRSGAEVKWDSLVNWSTLPSIRDDLDQLPDLEEQLRRHQSSDDGQNIFRRRGRDWELKFGDGPVNVFPNLDGLLYLYALVERTGAGFTPTELKSAKARFAGIQNASVTGPNSPAPDDFDAGQSTASDAGVLIDDQARREYQRRLKEIEEHLEDASFFGDEKRIGDLEDEKNELVRQLAAATGLGGRRIRMSPRAKNDRDAVRSSLKRAIRSLDEKDESLGDHFRNCIRLESLISYVPELPVVWIRS